MLGVDDRFQMPDKTVALLIRFLIQNNGIISKRARDKEFVALNDEEVNEIQNHFQGIFMDN